MSEQKQKCITYIWLKFMVNVGKYYLHKRKGVILVVTVTGNVFASQYKQCDFSYVEIPREQVPCFSTGWFWWFSRGSWKLKSMDDLNETHLKTTTSSHSFSVSRMRKYRRQTVYRIPLSFWSLKETSSVNSRLNTQHPLNVAFVSRVSSDKIKF